MKINDKKLQLLVTTLSLCTFLILISCSKNDTIDPEDNLYEIPLETEDGWETASLASVGINENSLLDLLGRLEQIGEHRIHSILIIKNGKLVFEEYFEGDKFNLAQYTGGIGFDMYDTHNLCSATKSFTSALIGIAVDKGFIESVDQKIFDFFPEYSELLTYAPEKNALTIKHLLMMASGIEWDDESYPYSDSRNDLHQMFIRNDPIRYILSKDLHKTPGTFYEYSNCNTNLLGEIVHKSSGLNLHDFSNLYLFSKLGITNFEWQIIEGDILFASGDLRLRPRDMAKFGYLFLKNGIWNDESIISSEWVNVSIAEQINPNDYSNNFGWSDGYGYQWWIWDFYVGSELYNTYMASGWGGQWIIVIPELDMVVVSTGGNYYTDMQMSVQNMIVNYIIPAVK